jgi:sigma-E factor negative regulatory protein RseB
MRLLLLVVLLLPTASLWAEDDPRVWLDRMSRSFRELNYDGVFIYETGREMRSLRLVHAVIDGVEHERVAHLTGPPREVIRVGHKLSCIHPGDELVRLDHSIPAGPFAKQLTGGLGHLDAHYELLMSGTERIAGRDAVLIEVRPRDAFRYGYQFSLDRDTALLLRSRLLDGQGRVLELFQFADITIGGEPRLEDLQPGFDGHHVAHHHLVSEATSPVGAAATARWRVDWVPDGFRIAASDLRRDPRQSRVESRMYTDGLAVFSVFVESSDERVEQGSAHHGATVAYTTPLTGVRGRVVTVVGEVPLNTARRVAGSVRLLQTAGAQ